MQLSQCLGGRKDRLRAMYKQMLGGRAQGLGATPPFSPTGCVRGQNWAWIATHSQNTAEAFGSKQRGR